jgi:predicted nucleic acid-binding protein
MADWFSLVRPSPLMTLSDCSRISRDPARRESAGCLHLGKPQQKAAAETFFKKFPKVATCPLTELALVRVWMQKGASGADADAALKDFIANYRSRLIPDDLSATVIGGLNQGHRQTTDSYLVMLAKHHGI